MRKQLYRFTVLNMSGTRTRQAFVLLMLGTALVFAVVGVFAMFQEKYQLDSSILGKLTSHVSARSLVTVMGEEIPFLQEHSRVPGMQGTISELTFELATSVNLKDPRTYLGRELPLFSLYDADFAVSSPGVDYTYLPVESNPPDDLNQQIAQALKEQGKNSSFQIHPNSINLKRLLIYNTHHWESYFPELPVGSKSATSFKVNVTQLSKYLAGKMGEYGIGAETAYQMYFWQGAYASSHKMVESVIKRDHTLTYFLDIHRNSNRRDKTTIMINGQPYARLVFVVGKASTNYEQNLQIAYEMYKGINKIYPGLCIGVMTKERGNGNNGEYNQSISPDAMLLEVGGVDNTFVEGYRSLDVVAKVLAQVMSDATPVTGK